MAKNKRKPRGDSPLNRLKPEDKEKLIAWINEGTLAEAAAKCKKYFRFSPAESSLSNFYSAQQLKQQFEQVQSNADTLVDLLKEKLPELDGEKLQDYGQSIFQMLAIQSQDPNIWKAVNLIEDRRRRTEVLENRVELDRTKLMRESTDLFVKWNQDKKARQIANSSIPTEEKTEKLGRYLFADLWDAEKEGKS